MDTAFHRAFDPETHECLGFRLQPLTLGHWFLLQKFCPAAVDSTCNAGSLDMAVLICSQPWRTSERELKRGWRLRLFLVLWGWIVHKRDKDKEVEKFERYMAEQFTSPMMQRANGDNKVTSNGPYVWKLYAILMAYLNFTRDAALDCSVLEAGCLAAVHSENSGMRRLKSQQGIWLWENRDRLLETLKEN